ncbi:hypothetical protein BDV36DRAFT_187341 [Aspergillus pseudocaelatus]|uniref:Uncharacterized protein n=1 Tax=Aspergillus pseudocaelatus TaxID=1825620 RepID=A0ABQ6WIS8_9EURO|nr:hypothetical protein BDV36DRAFT_187341 [Aspergillus pseudocaelatus]
MSPAPVAASGQQDPQLQTLAKAFEALLLTTQQFICKERSLQQKLEYAYDEYMKLAGRLPSGLDTHVKIISEKIRGHSSEYGNQKPVSLSPPDIVRALAESGNVGNQTLKPIADGVVCYKSILNSQCVPDLNPCLVATRAGAPGSLEKDFTTKGTQGNLHCPFTKSKNMPSDNGMANGIENPFKIQNSDTCGHESLDPIKAERNDRRSSQTPSVRTSTTQCPVARCPIRYLDQHSPEEIADYVERHKHEIPRSHAICVQRYQKDSHSMRHLDAKYGSLINMIRGLSVKHQAFLPNRGNSGAPTSSSSAERVEKWAEEVGINSEMQPSIKEDETENDDGREGRFDRPLREVRVGESPSRPWGIPVPMPLPPSASPPLSPPPAAALPEKSKKPSEEEPIRVSSNPPRDSTQQAPTTAPKSGRCPFGHGVAQAVNTAPETETIRDHGKKNGTIETAEQDFGEQPQAHPPLTNSPASIVFNGPVFFGFSPEQTSSFLQQLGSLVNKQ